MLGSTGQESTGVTLPTFYGCPVKEMYQRFVGCCTETVEILVLRERSSSDVTAVVRQWARCPTYGERLDTYQNSTPKKPFGST